MYQQDDEGFLIVTDTLATTLDGVPLFFQDKLHYYPHLRLGVAGTGWGDFVAEWQRVLSERVVGRNAELIDNWATGVMASLYAELAESIPGRPAPTVTIYHFGFSAQNQQPVRFTYRSTKGFASERSTESGFAWKPYEANSAAQITAPETIDEWIALALRIRAEQDARPHQTRIHIGGELIWTALRPGGAQRVVMHTFSDFEDHWQEMLEGLSAH